MKRTLVFVILFSTLVISNLIAQSSVTVFGPRVFERATGQPVTVTVNFTVGSDAISPFVMHLTNGKANGDNRVSSATIKLNGTQIFSPSDFSQQVYQIDRSVNLIGDNILEVRLASKPGSYLTFNITATSVAAPVITIYTPPADIITNQYQISVTGKVDGITGTTATINNNPLTLAGDGTFSATVPLTVEGTNPITVKAVTPSGVESECTRTVMRDTQTPILTITRPENGLITDSLSIQVRGTISDPSPVTLKVNNTVIQYDSLGIYATQLNLNEGLNTIAITATDDAGNQTTLTRIVRRDTQAPQLNIQYPINDTIVSQQTINVSGIVKDSTKIRLTVNGELLTVNTNGTFNYDLPVVEGLKTITVTAIDSVGNDTTVARIIRRDTEAPAVNITSPIDSLVTNQQTITVSGTVADSTKIQLTVNGVALTIGENGAFSTVLTLTEGMDTVKVTATDAAGNQTTIIRHINRHTTPPILTIISPIDSLLTKDSLLTIQGKAYDQFDLTLTINGVNVNVGADSLFSTQLNLQEGINTITAVATDAVGNKKTEIRTIVLDTHKPNLIVNLPINNYLTNKSYVIVNGSINDYSMVQLTVNAKSIIIAGNGSFTDSILVSEGNNTITFTAIDAVGNDTTIIRNVYLDSTAPLLTISSPQNNITVNENTIVLIGVVTDSTEIQLTVNGEQITIGSGGAFNYQISLIEGTNTITISAVDAIGQTTTVLRNVIFENIPLPPDPATVAPNINGTMVTTMAAETEFLYTGQNPIQTGVEPGTIDPMRVAVIHGKVLKRDLTPLSGVKITILNHSEYGSTFSRADGKFDIAVNGGGYSTVNYQKQGYLQLQRQVEVPWRDYIAVDSVLMIQLDTIVTTINFSDSVEVARGSVITDQDGMRRATLLFKQGTTAKMISDLGDTVALPSINVRATEYTVGPSGPQAMPAELPATSGYTYCVELSTDEALQAGSNSVVFNKPVPVYIDNFLNFPAGFPVPAAYYDKQSGLWMPINDGRVIKILDIINGIAEIDADGDDFPDQPDSLIVLGIDSTERQKIASLYPAGRSLWRVEVMHFSAYDFNYGIVAEIGAENPDIPAPTINNPTTSADCTRSGSIIGVQKQSLGQVMPVTGTPFSMYYQSNRVKGRVDDYSLVIPLSGDNIPAVLKKIHLEILIAGQDIVKDFQPSPNLNYIFTWDGKNKYGGRIEGSKEVAVRIAYVYDGYYFPPPSLIKSFGNESCCPHYDQDLVNILKDKGINSYASVLEPARVDVYRWQFWQGTLGKWDVSMGGATEGFGGWSLDVHHVYDPNSRTVYFGDGRTNKAVSESAIINATAGYGERGFHGEGTTALVARMDLDRSGIALGPDESIYIADSYNNRIRRVSPAGVITTIAGTGTNGFSGDEGQATQAQLSFPTGVALGQDGSIYIADQGNCRIRRVDCNGKISTIAGDGVKRYTGDGGPALSASFSAPSQLTVGPDGCIYVSDDIDSRIRKISPDGFITSIVGTGVPGFSGDSSQSSLAQIDIYRSGMAVTSDGSLYFSDYNNNRVRRVYDSKIYTVAGNGGGISTSTSWNSVNNGLTEKNIYAMANSGSNIFIGTNNGIFLSTDNGLTWNSINAGLTNKNVISLVVSGSSVFAGTFGGGVFRSTNNGAGWADVSLGLGNKFVYTLAVNGTSVFAGTDGGVYRSDNYGGTWNSLKNGLTAPFIRAFTVNGVNIYAGAHSGTNRSASSGVFKSTDNGNSWKRVNTGITDSTILSLTSNGTSLFAGAQDGGGIFRSTNNGESWTAVNNGLTIKIEIKTLLADGSNLFAGVYSGGVFLSTDNGANWTAVNNGLTYKGVRSLVTADSNLFAGTNKGAFLLQQNSSPKATEVNLSKPVGVAIGKDGNLYISESGKYRIRKVDSEGYITTIAGTGNAGYTGNGNLARQATFNEPSQLAISSNGSIYISENRNCVIRKIVSLYPGYLSDETKVASEDGSEIYVFSNAGKHLYTLDALTGTTIYTFIYDTEGRLTAIRDIDSLVTQIERDSSGKPTAVVSAFGQRTLLTLNSDGFISAIKNPANETTTFTYSAEGLMKTLTDPKSNTHIFEYDIFGRLVYDEDPLGGFKTLTRTTLARGYEVEVTTAEGRSSKYRVESLSTGDIKTTNTSESGLTTVLMDKSDGTSKITYPDGTVTSYTSKPDPRFGMQSPLTSSITKTPGGLTSQISQDRIISKMTGEKITGLTDSVVVNRRIYKIIWDGEQKLFTSISSEGRRSFSWINDKGRVIKDSIPSIEAIYYTYDSKGRIDNVSQGGRTASYTYNEKSYLASAIDPIQRLSRFECDSVGRITIQTLPDSNQILYSYDANSNLISLTPPSKPAHNFDYTKVDLTNKYVPPILGIDTTTTRYEYNKDKQILKVIRPDGGVIETIYDSVGCSTCGSPVSRPKTILFDRGVLDFKYSPFTGNLDTLISPMDTLIYTYVGSLPTSVTSRGEINGFVSVDYDSNYNVKSQSINGGNTIDFSYDNDGLLMQSGSMSIAREPETGRISSTTLGNVTTSQSYNSLGELSGYQANYGGNPIFQTSYQRDSLGRITQINEIVEGKNEKKNYAYDIAGRLWKVWRNDTLISTYTYDPNGNRIAHITPTSADSGTYDAQDRMLTYGNAQYIYSKNGELQKKIVETDTTSYTYDYFGNLITVMMPNGDQIDYIIDGQNRRIGKKLNGQIVKRWIYSGQLSPVAELDSAGNVIARFAGGYMIKGGNIYQLVVDHLGSVKLVVDVNTGIIAQRLNYDEYGNVLNDSNPDFQPFTYASGLYETQTKLVRFGYRDYSAETGRWMKKDPIGFNGNQINIFIYIQDDPINNIDLFGFSTIYYSRSQGLLYVTPEGANIPLLIYPAANNVTNPTGDPYLPESHGPAPNGTFEMGDYISTGNDSNSSFGIGFIPIKLPPKGIPYRPRTGVGLHSGRKANCKNPGPSHKTEGCIRTTDEAMKYLKTDPPTKITIGD